MKIDLAKLHALDIGKNAESESPVLWSSTYEKIEIFFKTPIWFLFENTLKSKTSPTVASLNEVKWTPGHFQSGFGSS